MLRLFRVARARTQTACTLFRKQELFCRPSLQQHLVISQVRASPAPYLVKMPSKKRAAQAALAQTSVVGAPQPVAAAVRPAELPENADLAGMPAIPASRASIPTKVLLSLNEVLVHLRRYCKPALSARLYALIYFISAIL